MGNSTSFKPGQVGNPHGRPKKGKTLTDILAAELKRRTHYADDGSVISGKQRLAKEILNLAFDRDAADKSTRLAALKYAYDRIDGRPDVFQHIIEDDSPQIIIAGPDGGDAQ